MTKKASRVLWLLNHTTLRAFEIPLLRSLGYEVYTPKNFPDTPGNRSSSVDYSWDSHLTIPEQDLLDLNRFDFYEGRFSLRIRDLINRHFETAIVAYLFPLLDNMIQYFRGRTVLRAFGLTSRTSNYYDHAKSVCDPGFTRRFSENLDRLWFGQAYPNLDVIEPEVLRRRSVYLPLGLPDSIISKRDQWTGGKKQILFVCPDINFFDEAGAIYRNFKKTFGSFPHVIGGNQFKPVADDPSVVGRLDSHAYEELFRESAVMFYHSTLPRHLHYHPLEALFIGMPLVFMRDGMLGELGGRDLPGGCSTVSEARKKIGRVLKGDSSLIEDIRSSQKQLLKHFEPDVVLQHWRQSFVNRVQKTPVRLSSRYRRIAILYMDELGSDPTESVFALGRSLQSSDPGQLVEYVVGTPSADAGTTNKLKARNAAVNVRNFSYATIDIHSVKRAQEFEGFKNSLEAANYCLPDDGISQFMDCDFWIIFSNCVSMPIAPIKPYAVVSTDLSYWDVTGNPVSAAQKSAFSTMARSAEFVFSNSSAALDSLERRCGVGKGCLLNIGKKDNAVAAAISSGSDLLWITNSRIARDDPELIALFGELVGDGKPFGRLVVASREADFSLNPETLEPSKESPRALVQVYEQLKRSSIDENAILFEDRMNANRWKALLEKTAAIWWPEWTWGGLELCRIAEKQGVPIVARQSLYAQELDNTETFCHDWSDDHAENLRLLRRASAAATRARSVSRWEFDVELLQEKLRCLG